MLNGKSVLITGGTGSLGKAFVSHVLKQYPKISRLVIFSRDELKQYEMEQQYPLDRYGALRYFLGDVRDRDRLVRAFNDIDVVIHAAALKQVPAAEYNPMEFIRTNVIGAENVIEAAIDAKVEHVVALSTDKAAAPINLYGATKLCSDKLFTASSAYAGNGPKFSVVRYGNVLGSRGSVVPLFLEGAKKGVIPITDEEMTRFSISLSDGVDLVLWTIENAYGGEIVVPKIPSYRILDVAQAIAPSCSREVVGIRPGEKLHEEMITSADSFNTIVLDDKFVIANNQMKPHREYYLDKLAGKHASPGFNYCSGTNEHFLSVEDIRKQIVENLDPKFKPI